MRLAKNADEIRGNIKLYADEASGLWIAEFKAHPQGRYSLEQFQGTFETRSRKTYTHNIVHTMVLQWMSKQPKFQLNLKKALDTLRGKEYK